MQAAMRPVGWMPLGSRRTMPPLDPLPVAIEQNDMYTSSQLRAAAHHNSLRRFGQLVPPQTADPTSSKMMLGEATTVSQLAFRRPPSSFSHSFGVVDRTNGKLRDGTTDFREQVYTMWEKSEELQQRETISARYQPPPLCAWVCSPLQL